MSDGAYDVTEAYRLAMAKVRVRLPLGASIVVEGICMADNLCFRNIFSASDKGNRPAC